MIFERPDEPKTGGKINHLRYEQLGSTTPTTNTIFDAQLITQSPKELTFLYYWPK